MISYFPKGIRQVKPEANYLASEIVDMIRSGIAPTRKDLGQQIELMRRMDNPATKQVVKLGLPYVTWSGEFTHRKDVGIKKHSGLVCLDFDHIVNLSDPDKEIKLEAYKTFFSNAPFVAVVFISPSGDGLKVVCRINEKSFSQDIAVLTQNFVSEGEIIICDAGASKDISRACFLSHDPKVYFNPDADIFIRSRHALTAALPSVDPPAQLPLQDSDKLDPSLHFIRDEIELSEQKKKLKKFAEKIMTAQPEPETKDATDYSKSFQQAHESAVEKWGVYIVGAPGNRNDYVYRFARECNFKGVPELHTAEFALNEFTDLTEEEIRATVNSAYKHHTDEHNKQKPSKKKVPVNKPGEKTTGGNDSGNESGNEKLLQPDSASSTNPPAEGEPAESLSEKDQQNTTRAYRQIVVAESYLQRRYDLRNNVIKNAIEISTKRKFVWEEFNENNIFREFQHNRIPYSLNKLLSLVKSDYVSKFNPFKHYFENLEKTKPWKEGDTDHIAKFSSYVTATDQDRFNVQLKKHLVRSVMCALVDGYFNKQCFTLVSPVQDIGKSSWCHFMCPPALEDYYVENLPLQDKDGLKALTENFIINLDELASLAKFEIKQLKSILAKPSVKMRPAYEKRVITFPRVATFYGSTNESEFLSDETGSIRWLCFYIEKINWSYRTDVDIDMVYSQAHTLFKNGFDCQLTKNEAQENENANARFQRITTERELIAKKYYPGNKDDHDAFLTSTDIMNEISKELTHSIRISPENVGKALGSLGFDKEQGKRSKDVKHNVYGYYVKFLGPDGVIPATQTKIKYQPGTPGNNAATSDSSDGSNTDTAGTQDQEPKEDLPF